ncbi:MAG TPA: pyridoxal-phosphate dependent enzyme, partial [Terriglobales bacterium]
LEIAEQLAWCVPDWVAMSVGDGCSIAGLWKAFQELKLLRMIDRTPRILGVQAEGAAPVTEAFRTGNVLRPMKPRTIADSIAVGVPRNWRKAVLAVRESGGTMINVADEEILESMRYCGRLTGIFAEPAAAAAVAGLERALSDGIISRKSSAVAVITGNGLKDISSAQKAAGAPFETAADGAGVEEILNRQGLLHAAGVGAHGGSHASHF